jgi:hypothetical protein
MGGPTICPACDCGNFPDPLLATKRMLGLKPGPTHDERMPLEARIASLESDNARLRAQVEDAETHCSSLVSARDLTIRDLRAQVAEATNLRVEDLPAGRREVEAMRAQLATAHAEADRLRAALCSMLHAADSVVCAAGSDGLRAAILVLQDKRIDAHAALAPAAPESTERKDDHG